MLPFSWLYILGAYWVVKKRLLNAEMPSLTAAMMRFDFSLHRHPIQPDLDTPAPSGEACAFDRTADRALMKRGIRIANMVWAALVVFAAVCLLILL